MKKLLCGLMAFACATLLASPSMASTPNCESKDLAGNCIPGAVLMDPTTGLPYSASGGGGGSLSAKANASPQTSTEGATTDPLSMDLSRNLRVLDATVAAKLDALIAASSDTSSSAVKIDQTTPGTTNGVQVNSSALPTGAATSAAQATLNGCLGTVGSTAPTCGMNVTGTGPSGNARSLQTSTSGGLLPGQASPTSTRTAVTASTATQVDSARSTRLLATVQLDGSPTAAVYICFTQTTSCSATVYDIKVASGAVDATIYTAPFGSTSAIYVYTTASGVTVNVSSWLPL